jgi:hypothetical protein
LGQRGSIRGQPLAAAVASILMQISTQLPYHGPRNHTAPRFSSRTAVPMSELQSSLQSYTMYLSALFLLAACIAKCPMCQRSVLSPQDIEEQLDPRRVESSDGRWLVVPTEATTIECVMYRMVRCRSFFPIQGPNLKQCHWTLHLPLRRGSTNASGFDRH